MKTEALSHLWPLLENALLRVPNEIRRLFHGRGQCYEGLEQITVDWLQGQLSVHLFKTVTEEFLDTLKQGLLQFTETEVWSAKEGRAIVLQHRYIKGSPYEVLYGEADLHPVVCENGLNYQLELGKNQNYGLFLDMRKGRDWVRSCAKGKKVLNLFAYTCGFSVAAIEGGASHVVNVDMAKSMLNRGRDNHHLNGHQTQQVTFLGHNILKSWGKIKRLGLYDIIIIDPPTFQRGSFEAENDYPKIVRRIPQLLADGGEVLACVNSPWMTPTFLIDLMEQEVPGLRFKTRLENPPEFKDKNEDSSLKALVFG